MKNFIGILVLLLGAAATYYFLVEGKSPLINTVEFKDFAIEDTASVNKIFMSRSNGQKILLTKGTDGLWLVNNEFPARKDAIKLILKTLHDIQILGNIAKEKFEHNVKRLATQSTKVEYYTGGDNPEKTWYIGDPTESRLGTYMLLEKDGVKSSTPFAMHLLMERGYLSTRFFLDPILWRDRIFFKTNPKDIESITVDFFADSSISYSINQAQAGNFILENLKTGEKTALPSEIAVPYFKEFSSVYYEYIDVNTPQEQLDSVYGAFPRHEIKITVKGKGDYFLKSYNMPVAPGSVVDGVPIYAHPERMYAFSSYMTKDSYTAVQNLTFDKLVPSIDAFRVSTTVEK